MKVFITGGTGFVGTHLTRMLLDQGHDVTCVGRSTQVGQNLDRFHYISADTTMAGSWQECVKDMDAVVNLAGATIFKRWNRAYKTLLRDSRILTTRHVVDALPKDGPVLISASAVGYYGERKDDILTESDPPGDDFLALLSRDWEEAAFQAREKGVRTVAARFGVVLGRNGGALATMVPLFKWFLGGPMGRGRHWFPWIHVDDLCAALCHIMQSPGMSGPVNITTPIPIRQKTLARSLGRQLGRPALMPAPAFMIRLVMGEMGRYMMVSQKVIPDQLIKHGYKFKFMEIQPALEDLLPPF